MSILWSLQLRREAASVPFARRLLLGAMETAGVDPDVCYDLCVALSEACANAVEHGGKGAGPGAAYQVTAYLDGERCRIEVADSGPGFSSAPLCPFASEPGVEAESGRGLMLIQKLADHVRVDNLPGAGGAVVSFDKLLKLRDNAPLTAAV
ncbi:ATP-binding protein [Streptomyces sp. NPDC005012]|uniref:ATP-binding protein n=1 Tax=unclassified Streptomyces TaxID=2593676 RepID=UPI0033BDBC5B